MKILIINILLFLNLYTYGQIPVIKSNTTELEKSTIYKKFQGKYDFLIAYTEESYWWSNKEHYQILGLKEGHWSLITLTSKRKKNGEFTKPSIRIDYFDNNGGQILLSQLNQTNFWALERDSLNIKHRQNPDSTKTEFSLSDGVNFRFEILTKEGFRIIEAYEPEYFFEKIPEIKARQRFIINRDIFRTILKDYGT
jgi:hypothetical protein